MVKPAYIRLLVLTMVVFSLFVVPFFAHAQTESDVRNKISDHSAEIAKLEAEIAQYKKDIEAIGNEKNTLARAVKELDLTKKKLEANIKVTENKIAAKNLEIKTLSLDIQGKEEKIELNKEAIGKSLRQIKELDLTSTISTLLSENKFTDLWIEFDSLRAFQGKINQLVDELKKIKSGLEFDRTDAVKVKNELLHLKSDLVDQKALIVQNTKEKNKLLSQTKNKESNYKKLVQEKIKKKEAFEVELRDYESQLKFILDRSLLPGRGVFSWPLDNVYITQKFGRTVAAQRLYLSGSHSGVDFRASVGTPIRAMADGVVLDTGDTDITCPGASFGRFVFIRYHNGLSSTFAHLSLIKASQGEAVSRGQVVGYSGNTGYSTAPHLHVTVYASRGVKMESRPSRVCGGKIYTMPIAAVNAYLDPLEYMPAFSASMTKPDF